MSVIYFSVATTLQIFQLSLVEILQNQCLNFSTKNSIALCVGPCSYFIYLKAPHYVASTLSGGIRWFPKQFLLYNLYEQSLDCSTAILT